MPDNGAADMARRIRALAREFPKARNGALYEFANDVVMAKSLPLVPVEYGVLKGSAKVDQPVETAYGATIALGYGGAAEAYAWIVHEDPDAKHPTGQWKYLEQPLKESSAIFLSFVGASIQRRTGISP